MSRLATIATVSILAVGCFDDPSEVDGATGSSGMTSPTTGDSSASLTATGDSTASTVSDATSTGDGTVGTGTTGPEPSTSADSSSGGPRPSCEPGPPRERTLVYINSEEMVQTLSGPSEFACEGFMVDEVFFGTWVPWGPLPNAVIADFESHWADYPIDFAYERPLNPPYEMVIVTSELSPVSPSFATDASRPDCFNANPDSIGFAFLSPEAPALHMSSNLSRAVAWALGLELSDQVEGELPKEITSDGAPADVYAFINECRPLLFANDCADAHAQHCGEDEQNSAAELAAALSPR